jgi:thiamine biosynthesis lipoprotein
MQQTKDIMGMHVTVEALDEKACTLAFDYLTYIDETFSTYKSTSEISKINRGELTENEYSADMKEIFKLAEQTRLETNGYFNIKKTDGTIDPSGIVKGWAIWQAGLLLEKNGYKDFFVDVGGDIQAHSTTDGKTWRVGIRNPFNLSEIVKVLEVTNEGVATSGTYERGQHIYNPLDQKHEPITEILSITVVGPNILEADRFATAAFAMGNAGIHFIESLPGLEAYMIDSHGIATQTSGLDKFITT